MTKTNKPMDEKVLQEQYEEIKIRLLMARFAEMEGKQFQEENEDLRKEAFYLPSEKTKRRFVKKLNRRFVFFKLFSAFRNLLPSRFPKVAFITMLIMITLLVCTLSVEAIRTKVLNMFIQVQQEYTEIRSGQDSSSFADHYLVINWENAYVPTKVPEGYKIVEVKDHQTMKVIEYKNNNGDTVLFQHNTENNGMNVDTENADKVMFTTIHGNQGLAVEKNGVTTLVWHTGDNQFFLLGSSVTLDELVETAESVTILK